MNVFSQMAATFSRIAPEMYPDRCDVQEIRASKGSSGGNTVATADRFPKGVPCRYRPAGGKEIERAGRPLSGSVYRFRLPAQFESQLVDIDATCQLVVAESGMEPIRTFKVQWLARTGLQLEVLATLEE